MGELLLQDIETLLTALDEYLDCSGTAAEE
jgi:hypothetical protein